MIPIHNSIPPFKFLCLQHNFFLLCKSPTRFLHLFVFIPSYENDESLCDPCICLGYLTSISIIYPMSLSSSSCLTKSSSKLIVFYFHWKVSTGTFCDIAHPYSFFTFEYMKYDETLFKSWSFKYFQVFVVGCYMKSRTYSTSATFLYH